MNAGMVMAPTPNPSSRCGFRQKYRTPAAPHGQRSHLQLAHPVSNLLRSTGSPASYRKCNLNFQPHRTPTTRCGKAYPVSNVFKFSQRKLQTLRCFLVVYQIHKKCISEHRYPETETNWLLFIQARRREIKDREEITS